MPKNLLPNHFDTAGIYVEGQRSGFRFDKPHIASFMSGMLVPLGDPIPVFPGVKLDLNVDAVIRSNTMVVPPLDGIYVDFFTVWVPHRIVWNHMAQFLGENDTTAWTQSDTYIYPSVKLSTINDTLYNNGVDSDGLDPSTIYANLFLFPHYGLYYGNGLANLPAGNLDISVLSARGYYSIWNHFFRDENYQRPVLFSKGDTGSQGEFGYFLRNYKINNSDGILDELILSPGDSLTVGQASLMPVNKFHDAFTSVLPQPQFGDGAELSVLDEVVPITSQAELHLLGNIGLRFGSFDVNPIQNGAFSAYSSGNVGVDGSTSGSVNTFVGSTNLVADLSNATAITVNQLRTSVMYQRYLEALARGGRRVPEYYNVIYGVKNSAAAKDYPVMMTRSRYMLGVNQVVATADSSGDGWTSHLGDTGAYSLTNLRNIPCVENDFTEFGYLHILYAVRSGNRYSQMVQPHFIRSTLLDEYNPFFDHIGDVGVPNTVVNVLASTAGNFGYQEAWWDERSQLGLAVGAVNKLYGSLSYWILGEKFDSSLITATASYLTFDPGIYDDVFVSNYCAYPQFIIDARISGKKIARMSQHSIPGIVGRI